MADAVSFACLHQSEESVHAQKDSFLKTMENHATVIYSVLRENLRVRVHKNQKLSGKFQNFKITQTLAISSLY